MYMHCQFPQFTSPLGNNAFEIGAGDDITFSVVAPFDKNGDRSANLQGKLWRQNNQSMIVDHYVHYDGLMIIVNGLANTRF
jgi:hypothetical protein